MFEIHAKTGTVTWGDFVIAPETHLDEFMVQHPEIISTQKRRETGGLVETGFLLGLQSLEDQVAKGAIVFLGQHAVTFNLTLINDTSYYEPWWDGLQQWIPAARKWLRTQFGEPHEINSGVLAGEESECPPDFVALIDTNWVYRFDWGKVGLYYEPLDSDISLYVVYDIDVQMAKENQSTSS
jgi:hypothetical protein